MHKLAEFFWIGVGVCVFGQNLHQFITKEAAGDLVFVRGDAAAKALSKWAESNAFLVRR